MFLPRIDFLKNLIEILRISMKSPEKTDAGRFREIVVDERENELLAEQIFSIVHQKKFVSLLSESGFGDNVGIFSEAFSKLSYKLLPPVSEDDELVTDLNFYFNKKDDYKWVREIPDEEWAQFFTSLKWPDLPVQEKYIEKEILNTIVVLAQKIASIGIEREVISKIPHLDDLDSPFLGLNREVTMYVEKLLHQPEIETAARENDYKHILVMLGQCRNQMGYLYKHKDHFGISLRMTLMIRKLENYLTRIRDLIEWIEAPDTNGRALISAKILKEVVYTQNTKYSLRKHFSTNLQFLSFKIVENTSKTGEHYIATNQKEYWKLFRMALGGGVVVAFLCCFKSRIALQHFPLFWEAFFYSLNYSVGFILIHVLHFTLATKQPAMTASTIAASLSNNGENPDWLSQSTKLLTRQIRSQFISLLGNALIAFPVAYFLDWVYFYANGRHIVNAEKALKMINDLNPTESYALFHAGIAGIYLMVSGLISGYYENKWIYNKMYPRIVGNKTLISIFGKRKLEKAGVYLENNIGGLAGNFFLGLFLGCTAAIGFTLGLPLDIRHVTFASGNFGIAVASLEHEVSTYFWVNSLVGIALIGLVNVIVSFGLSIMIALNSRNTGFAEIKQLFSKLFGQFFQNGGTFFYPVGDLKKSGKQKPQMDGE